MSSNAVTQKSIIDKQQRTERQLNNTSFRSVTSSMAFCVSDNRKTDKATRQLRLQHCDKLFSARSSLKDASSGRIGQRGPQGAQHTGSGPAV